MKLFQRLTLGFMALLLLAVISWTVFAQNPAHPAYTWEYKIFNDNDGDHNEERRISQLGAQGWELVNSLKIGDSAEVTFIFKRPK